MIRIKGRNKNLSVPSTDFTALNNCCISDKLKGEIAIHVHLNTLKRVEIFQVRIEIFQVRIEIFQVRIEIFQVRIDLYRLE